MSDHTVAASGDRAQHVAVPRDLIDLLTIEATRLAGERGGQLYTGIERGKAPRHVADMLIGNVTEAIDARTEIIAAAEADGDPRISTRTLRLVGESAIDSEKQRISCMWEMDSDDFQALAEYTNRLNELDRLLTLHT